MLRLHRRNHRPALGTSGDFHAAYVHPVYEAQKAAREAENQRRIAQVEELEQRYFLADAIAHHIGNEDGHRYQRGIASGVAAAIAVVIDKDPIYVACRLERAKSPLTWGTLPWVPQDYTNAYDHILDENERRDARHRAALKADGHPLYTILFHPERLA